MKVALLVLLFVVSIVNLHACLWFWAEALFSLEIEKGEVKTVDSEPDSAGAIKQGREAV